MRKLLSQVYGRYRIDGLTPMQLQMIVHYLKEAPADPNAWELSNQLVLQRAKLSGVST